MKHILLILLVVSFSQIVYAEKNNVVYKLVGQEWTLEAGKTVLKCLYRYDMANKLVTINYSYPCPKQIINKLKQ